MFCCDSFKPQHEAAAKEMVKVTQKKMKFVSLLSGGKDSVMNTMECVALGHELLAVGTLKPLVAEEQDSFMYQTVGVEVVPLMAKAMDVPLYQRTISGGPANQDLYYQKTEGDQDEVEDLFELLSEIKAKHPDLQAVASGAIFSNYQRLRVENCCARLGLVSLSYLWLRPQEQLLRTMIEFGIDARIIKVCSLGLESKHLGMSIKEPSLLTHFASIHEKYGFNWCGEGGEFESAVFDCPLFKTHKIAATAQEVVDHDPKNDVAYMKYNALELVEKSAEEKTQAAALMEKLTYQRANGTMDFIDAGKNDPAVIAEIRKLNDQRKVEISGDDVSKLMQQRVTLSASIIKPDLTKEELAAMTQKDQLLMIMEEVQKRGLLPYIIKVGLLVSDLTQFAPLNAEYVKFFGLRPPVRVCVQIPNDEVVMFLHAWNPQGEQDQQKALAKMRQIQENMHVQGLSFWGPPNVGPYSQVNKLDNVIYMAGNIGLYPPALGVNDPENIATQYRQIMDNYNKVLWDVNKDAKIQPTWDTIAQSAAIFVEEKSDVPAIMEMVKHDYKVLEEETVIVRVAKLPLNVLIEIEMVGDSIHVAKETKQKWKTGCVQKCYSSLEEYAKRGPQPANLYGEIFYNRNIVSKQDVVGALPDYKVGEETASIIPTLELINPFSTEPVAICERFYNQF